MHYFLVTSVVVVVVVVVESCCKQLALLFDVSAHMPIDIYVNTDERRF